MTTEPRKTFPPPVFLSGGGDGYAYATERGDSEFEFYFAVPSVNSLCGKQLNYVWGNEKLREAYILCEGFLADLLWEKKQHFNVFCIMVNIQFNSGVRNAKFKTDVNGIDSNQTQYKDALQVL